VQDRVQKLTTVPTRYRDWFWLLWPPAWFTIFSATKDFSSSPVLGSATLNAAGLHVWRRKLAAWMCARRRKRMRAFLAPDLVDQWDATGLIRIDNFLEPARWAAVCDELLSAALPMTEMAQPPALTRRANLDVSTCSERYPALLSLVNDRRLMGLLQYAAGYPGRPVVSVQCVHSDSRDAQGRHDPQTDWHADTFHSTAKAWLFLHPVGERDGPFGYRSGSHALTAQRLRWEHSASIGAADHVNRLHARGSLRASDADLAAMGLGGTMVATVPGNTLMIADTSGFHRRMPSPAPTVRVEVYFSLRRNPFFAGLYPGILDWPVMRDRWAGWLFAWYVWLRACGRPSWIPSQTAGLNEIEKGVLRPGAQLKSPP
jgi:hypothetical protein